VGPLELLAIAYELLAAPPAQPPSPQAITSSAAAIAARGARNKIADASLIAVKRYR
jgi:hypothetical protein